tara:strand:+ start:2892 stop:3929 length:1038 start_codon:yes stop_codon:yes gene_type:complete
MGWLTRWKEGRRLKSSQLKKDLGNLENDVAEINNVMQQYFVPGQLAATNARIPKKYLARLEGAHARVLAIAADRSRIELHQAMLIRTEAQNLTHYLSEHVEHLTTRVTHEARREFERKKEGVLDLVLKLHETNDALTDEINALDDARRKQRKLNVKEKAKQKALLQKRRKELHERVAELEKQEKELQQLQTGPGKSGLTALNNQAFGEATLTFGKLKKELERYIGELERLIQQGDVVAGRAMQDLKEKVKANRQEIESLIDSFKKEEMGKRGVPFGEDAHVVSRIVKTADALMHMHTKGIYRMAGIMSSMSVDAQDPALKKKLELTAQNVGGRLNRLARTERKSA